MGIYFRTLILHIDLAFLILLKDEKYCAISGISEHDRNDFFIDLINKNPIDVEVKRFLLKKYGAVERPEGTWVLNVKETLIDYILNMGHMRDFPFED
ncbi:hypothetical protein [Pedobacter rhodius]|uniref:Uncharacterized protein n=1 Tax=Pedobacter rhodius TaxID=3004098 RepID=A0ABT4KYH3_9SPHI|nr:hypothetical protein [Pedobacter sp. SJ11]MCZ4222913.1 hypothetical protein [Pedobacter sp. SJ11]